MCFCRIWGEHGQSSLERARVCVLNCGPTGSEALKNLVLGGIGSFTIVDASKVSPSDLGNNYLGELRLMWPPDSAMRGFDIFWICFSNV